MSGTFLALVLSFENDHFASFTSSESACLVCKMGMRKKRSGLRQMMLQTGIIDVVAAHIEIAEATVRRESFALNDLRTLENCDSCVVEHRL